MQPTFTPAVATALQKAQSFAFAHGAKEVQPVHLFQGLLQETEGRVATALQAAGLDISRIDPAEPSSSVPPLPPQENAAPPWSQETQVAFDEARQLAKELSDDHVITSDQLAYVLLKRHAPLRADLERKGLSFIRLEAGMRAESRPPLRLDEPLHLADVSERMDTSRIMDAAANRAREALRVLEDYARFALDDAWLSRELKSFRHELTALLTGIPAKELLQARDTLRDVGTIPTPSEPRYSLAEVVQAGCKRLQEALRSLEEFGKLRELDLGAALEQLRYRGYTLEKALLGANSARQRLADCRLYVLVSGAQCAAALDWTIAEAAAGGAQIIQLREKTLPDRELIDRARKVRQWTRQAGILFIMNDRPDIARIVEADGVHLGQEDMSVKDARRLVGSDALIGVSTHTLEQVRQAVQDGASYLGIGPTFVSRTKDFAELSGIEFISRASAETSLPAFALGGINLDNLAVVLEAGARRVAVSQVICQADDPREVAARLRETINQTSAK